MAYEFPAHTRNRVFDAVEEMEKRGCKSISLEMIADELAFAEGYRSARQRDSRNTYKGLGEALAWLVSDKLLFTSNRGNSYHTQPQVDNKRGIEK